MDFDFDFEDSSKEWRKNKKYKGNGYFVYCCRYVKHDGKQCRKTIYSQIIKNNYSNVFYCEENQKYINHKNKNIFCKQHLNKPNY